jgi:hypothetical protein
MPQDCVSFRANHNESGAADGTLKLSEFAAYDLETGSKRKEVDT